MRRAPVRSAVLAVAVVAALLPLGSARAAADPCDPPVTASEPNPADLAVGVSKVQWLTYRVWTNQDCDVDLVDVELYRRDRPILGPAQVRVRPATPASAAAAADPLEWTFNIAIDPDDLDNAEAGPLTVAVQAWHTDEDDPFWTGHGVGLSLLRGSRLANNARPEPVRKGKKITVEGRLTRANWEDYEYHGYLNRPVDLQFRTPSGSYSTVQTVRTGRAGTVVTRVTAQRDGCFRYVFHGSSTTPPVRARGDCVNVR